VLSLATLILSLALPSTASAQHRVIEQTALANVIGSAVADALHPSDGATNSNAPPAIRTRDEARLRAEQLARALTDRIVDQRLQQLTATWRAGGEPGAEALDALNTVEPRRLEDALSRPIHSFDAPRGRITGQFMVAGRVAPFVAYVPDDYAPNTAWPLHIDLHGGGGAPWKSCDSNWEQGQPAQHGVILVCPGESDAGWWMPHGEKTVLAALEHFRTLYHIDDERVSVGGASSGGFGTWHAATKFPWLWRAAIVRCAATPRDPETLNNLGEVPAFLIHGDQDHRISVVNSRRSYAILSDGGHPVDYIEVPEMGHRYGRRYNTQILEWLEPRRRVLDRKFEYRVVRRGESPERLHWLKPTWPTHKVVGELVSGEIVRAGDAEDAVNVVDVQATTDLQGFTVLLEDALWNPAHPVVVRYNGTEVYRGMPLPTIGAVLDSWVDHSDPGLLATHEVVVTLPTTSMLSASLTP